MKKSNVQKFPAKPAQKTEITALILEDHKPLKKFIKTMQSEEESFAHRKKAYAQFAPLLTIHAKSEEQALYTRLKEGKHLREQGFKGDTEHHVANGLVKEIENIKDEDEWTAKARVLAELVKHHIEEEEREVLKRVRKEFPLAERNLIGREYLERKKQVAVLDGFEPGVHAA